MRIRHDTRTGHWHRNWKSCQLSNPLSWPLWLLWRAIIPGALWCWWHGPHPPRWSPGITTLLSLCCTHALWCWLHGPHLSTGGLKGSQHQQVVTTTLYTSDGIMMLIFSACFTKYILSGLISDSGWGNDSRHRHLWRCTKRKRESWPANVGLSSQLTLTCFFLF